MNILLISLTSFISFITLGLGIVVLSRDTKRISFKFFFLASFFASLWIFVNTVFPYANYNTALLLGKISFSSAILIGTFMWLFVYKYLDEDKRFSNLLKVYSLLLTPLLVIASWTELIIKDVQIVENDNKLTYGIIHPLFGVILLSIFILILIELRKKHLIHVGQEKLQMTYLAWGFSITAFLSLLTNFIIPLVTGSSYYSRFGPISTIFFLGFTTFAIVKLRLFGVRFVLGRLMHFLSLSVIAFIVFYVVLNIQLYLWDDLFSIGAYLTGSIFAIIFTIFYWQSYRFLNNYIEKNIVNFQYSPEEELGKFAEKISTTLDIDVISNSLIDILSKDLQLENISINLLNKEGKVLINLNTILEIEEISKVLHHWTLTGKNKALIKKEIESTNHLDENPHLKDILELMKRHSIELILPFSGAKQFSGLLNIGLKKDKEGYTAQDIDFIFKMAETSSSAFSRSLLYEEVQQFNETLKDEVEDATEEIQEQKEQIEDAYKAERDRMNILSHELRTPLGTARNSVAMLKMLFEGGKLTKDNELAKRNFNVAMENLRREVVLLERIFTVSQIRAGTITIRSENVNCNEIITKSIEAFGHIAENKGVKVIADIPTENIFIKSDQAKLYEIVGNIFENSAKYTEKGTINISLKDLGDKVKFEIIDTGIGIPKEEIPKLGEQEYYKVNTYLKSSIDNPAMPLTRPDGTGLGMFVIKNLSKLLKGELTILSEVNKGTQINIIFPKN